MMCNALTKKGFRCKKKANSNGFCTLHNPDKKQCPFCKSVRCKCKQIKCLKCNNKAIFSGYCIDHFFAETFTVKVPAVYKFKYSNKNKTVTVEGDSYFELFNLKTFVRDHIIPYLHKGVIGRNPFNITQRDAEFFIQKNNEMSSETKLISDEEFLKSINIASKRDYRKWTIKNHPDKGGNTETFAKVTATVEKCYPT